MGVVPGGVRSLSWALVARDLPVAHSPGTFAALDLAAGVAPCTFLPDHARAAGGTEVQRKGFAFLAQVGRQVGGCARDQP